MTIGVEIQKNIDFTLWLHKRLKAIPKNERVKSKT